MKEEDLDWEVYHLIAADLTRDAEFLAAYLHCSPDDIQESFRRLERALLMNGRRGSVFISFPSRRSSFVAKPDTARISRS